MSTDVNKIFREGCLVALSISRWTNFKKIKVTDIGIGDSTYEVDQKWVGGVKKLINPEKLSAINSISARAINRIRMYSLPFPIRGIWFIPRSLISRLDNELKEDLTEFNVARDEIVTEWKVCLEEAKEVLGDLFNPSEYPSSIKEKFELSWKFFVLNVPDKKLNLLSAEQYEAEVEKLRQTVLEAEKLAVDSLRTQLKQILDHAIGQLKNTDSRIHKSLIDKFHNFFEIFRDKNIFGDNKLEDIVELARITIEDVDVKAIRSNDEFRKEVAEALEDVSKELEKAMVKKPERKLLLKIKKRS